MKKSRLNQVNKLNKLLENITVTNKKLQKLLKEIEDKRLKNIISDYILQSAHLILTLNTKLVMNINDLYASDKIDEKFFKIIKKLKKTK